MDICVQCLKPIHPISRYVRPGTVIWDPTTGRDRRIHKACVQKFRRGSKWHSRMMEINKEEKRTRAKERRESKMTHRIKGAGNTAEENRIFNKGKRKTVKYKPVGKCPGCGKPVWRSSIFRRNRHWHKSCWRRKKRSWES